MALFRYIQRPIFSAWRRPAAIVVPPRDYRYPLRVPRATRTFHVQLAGPQDVEDVGRIDSSRRSKDAPRYYPLPIGPDPRPVFEYKSDFSQGGGGGGSWQIRRNREACCQRGVGQGSIRILAKGDVSESATSRLSRYALPASFPRIEGWLPREKNGVGYNVTRIR